LFKGSWWLGMTAIYELSFNDIVLVFQFYDCY
jgi:hypothetical protein